MIRNEFILEDLFIKVSYETAPSYSKKCMKLKIFINNQGFVYTNHL
jgi:hypothetical protein